MDVAVVVYGASGQPPVLPAGWQLLAALAEPVHRVSAEILNAFAAADGERLLLIDAHDLTRGGLSEPSAAVVLDPFGSHSRWFSPNRHVPPWLAVLVSSADEHPGVLIAREALSQVGPFQQAENSIWQWTVRAALAGQSVLWESSPSADEFPQQLPALAPTRADRESQAIAPRLKSGVENLCDRIISQHDAIALQAGILQLHDDLDGSHELSQSIEGLGRRHAGDYWHAIMHSREGDFGNAKYWRRRVGRHPLFEDLAPIADEILAKCASPAASAWRVKVVGGGWNPHAFIDLCETCVRGRDAELTRAAEEIQFAEMHLLLAATYEDACGD